MLTLVIVLMLMLAIAVLMLAHDFYKPPAITVSYPTGTYDVKQLAKDLGMHLSHSVQDCPDVKYSDGPEGWNAYCACEVPQVKPKNRKKK